MSLLENMTPAIVGGLERLARMKGTDVSAQLKLLLKKAKDWYNILTTDLQDGIKSIANRYNRDLDTQLVYSYLDRDTTRWAKLGGTIYDKWYESLLPEDKKRLQDKARGEGVSLDDKIYSTYMTPNKQFSRGGRKFF